MSEEAKQCPFCGKEIKAVAKKCKHCGKWLDGRDNTQSITNSKSSFFNNGWVKAIIVVFVLAIIGYFIPEEETQMTTGANYTEENTSESAITSNNTKNIGSFEKQELYGDDIPDCVECPQEALEKLKTYCTQYQSDWGIRQCRYAIAARYCKSNNTLTQKFESLNEEDKNIFIDKHVSDYWQYFDVFYSCTKRNDFYYISVYESKYARGESEDELNLSYTGKFDYNMCERLSGLNRFHCFEQTRIAKLKSHDLSVTLQKIKEKEHYNSI